MGLLLALTACQTTGGVAPTKVACGVFRPISWSGKDTAQTQREVRSHNAAGREACGWR